MSETNGARTYRHAAWIVAALMLGGAMLRLWDLEHNPPGLWQDEASTGVDAYLIWTTGRDRAGDLLPIISRSFGDYPLALYRYLTAPIVGLFGLTIGHQRWVAAIAGISLMLSTFVVVRLTLGLRTALCVLLSAALTPTWIHFSRYGSEAMLLPATLMGGLALIEVARAQRRWWLIWAGAFVLGASAYTYHAIKLFLPLWIVPFLWYQWPLVRELWAQADRRKHVIGPAVVFALSVLPSMIKAVTPEGMARGNTVAAWAHSSGTEMLRAMGNNYLSYFEPNMLFMNGGPAVAQSIPGMGLWSGMDLPLMLVGFALIARRFGEQRLYGLVLAWFVLAPIPGGITYEEHNIGRVIGWLPSPQIISGIGMAAMIGWIAQAWASRRRGPVVAGLVLASALVAGWVATAIHTTRMTLIRYPRITERDWQFEISRAMLCAKGLRGGRKIVVSPSFSAAETFAMFHFSDLPREVWTVSNRASLAPDELYAAQAHDARPPGSVVVCEIKQLNNGETKSVVLAAGPAPIAPDAPIVPPAATMPTAIPLPKTK